MKKEHCNALKREIDGAIKRGDLNEIINDTAHKQWQGDRI